jgi:hypothetical protein
MNDLRRDLRAVFEAEQVRLGDLTGVRARTLRKALTAPEARSSQLFRTAVGLAVVLVAAAAVGATVYIRERNQTKPAATPTVSVSTRPSPSPTGAPTALANPLQVAASTPVILYQDPVNPDQIDGITWDGTARGRIATTGGPYGIFPNPIGTLYADFSDGGIHDRSGQMIARYPSGNQKGFEGIWADDEQHFCQMVSASALPPAGGEPATLRLGAPGTTPKNIAQVAAMYDQASAGVVACSVRHDRAVIVQWDSIGNSRQFWVVQLSTGRILLDSARLSITMQNVWASPDGQYIAVVRPASGQGTETSVYSPNGSLLGTVTGAIQAFSWDGTLAVISNADNSVSAIRWRDGSHLWDAPQGLTFDGALAEADGQRIAVALRNPVYQQTGGFPPVDLYVVGPDGQTAQLLQRVAVAF